ncbi:hemagglutinin repeat-containing protein [Chromobacterium haemolyticum]|uniref:Hemagglutinin repeat-containing protein n=1 Tax=Chromobacterium haemolyticum TaxID=394935 RepID=A0ABS3GM79_9NEIS|nr:hemagglutinin repeat-containing protein [Chromobacterium haemolyticum]MBK0414508.1 hemagglutinin repeat-containing protein [Chromobacterium haemolyticum]MBO0415858.1 hemagglutinin repeat-containing protein [Chromobacterium haemolyticum]MBO0499118.1 hemagglutinin repeat-containing protein [Chromobacterium haemolyticum]
MNPQCYRLVFNALRDMLMAVPEIASSVVGQPGQRVRGQSSAACWTVRPLVVMMLLAQPAFAQIIADPVAPASQRPTVLNTANGSVQINIQTPTAGGVSMNQYSQFNTTTPATVFNNSRTAVQTQSAGWVSGNPWLSTGNARVIVNQVNSQNPSIIKGTLEIAGARADLIIANPVGLVFDGVSVLNASRTTFAAGTPVLSGGSLEGYRVGSGMVQIVGGGLNDSQSDYTTVLARAVQLNAGLWAKQLKVVAGSNTLTADGDVSGSVASTSPAPGYALDVAALGGMYAGKITLLATEQGVGARNAGELIAQQDGLTLQANGWLDNSGRIASQESGALSVQTTAFNNSGTLSSARDMQVSTGALNNQGVINAGREVQVQASDIGNAAAGIVSGQRLQLAANTLTNAGQLLQTGSQALTLSAGSLQSSGNLGMIPVSSGSGGGTGQSGSSSTVTVDLPAVTPGGASAVSTVPVAPEALPDGEITVAGLLSNQGSLLANGGIDLSSSQGLSNHGAMALRNLQVRGGQLDNTGGSLNVASAHIQTDRILNVGGKLASSGLLQLTGGTLDNSQGQLGSQGDVQLQAGAMNNQAGQVYAAQLTINSGAVDNRQGSIVGTNVSATTGAVNNQQGVIAASNTLSLNTQGQSLLNAESGSGKGILAGGNMTLSTGTLTNSNAGRIQAAALTVQSGELSNADSTLSAQQVDIHSGALLNQRGAIQAAQSLSVDTQGAQLRNLDSGAQGMVSGGQLTLKAGSLDNSAGYIGSKTDLQVTAQSSVSNQGQMVSEGTASISTGSLDNHQGKLQSAGDLTVQLKQGALNNQQGLLQSGQHLAVTAGAVDNSATHHTQLGIQAGSLTLRAYSLNNAQGSTLANSAAQLVLSGATNNAGGQIAAGGSVSLATTTLSQDGGSVAASQDLALTANGLTGVGSLSAGRDLSLSVQQDLSVQANVQAGRNLSISTPGRLDNQAAIRAGNMAQLQANDIYNAAQGEISAGNLTLIANSLVENRGLIDGGTLSIEAGQYILNAGTGRIYGDNIRLSAPQIDNLQENGKAAVIAARQNLAIGASRLTNGENALIYSDGAMAIGGTVDAHGVVSGSATLVENQSATIESKGNMAISADTLRNERLRVAISQQSSLDKTVTMSLAAWQGNGHNGGDLHASANYRASQIYFIDPADIVSNDQIITPDGKVLGRAVVKLSPQTSSFFFASGRGWGMTGERWRVNIDQPKTQTIYYTQRQDGVINPDQSPNGFDPFALLHGPGGTGGAPYFSYQTDAVSYNAQYGSCSSHCVLLIGPYQLTDPTHTIVNRTQSPTQEALNERSRVSHHTAMDDVLASNAGAVATIRGGGDMVLQPGQLLDNRYGQIAAGGNLLIDGASNGAGSSKVVNTAATLYRDHHFDVTSFTYTGSAFANPQADIRETIGSVAASIQGNTSLTINAGGASNLDQGRTGPSPLSAAQPGSHTANVSGASNGTVTVQPGSGGIPGAIITSSPNVRLPSNSLFSLSPNGTVALIQTDPAFTNQQLWLGSDYLLSGLNANPATTLKRLGDGYYEQQLIRDQVAQLTGRRFLIGYASDEDQYRALMDNGKTFASAHQLVPGVALTPEQMAQLTSDIVWLVAQAVTLPNGQRQQVLVPQVYVKMQTGDLANNGAILAGDQVRINLNKNLDNQGTIAGRQLLAINADTLGNLGGRLQGKDVALNAVTDINNQGGTIQAGDSLAMTAGRDINVASTIYSQQQGSGNSMLQQTTVDRIAGLYVDGGAGQMLVSAGRNLALSGAQVQNQAAGGSTVLQAGQDVAINTVDTALQHNLFWDGGNWSRSGATNQAGSTMRTQGDLAIVAGRDIQAVAADISSNKGQVQLQAARDISLGSGQQTRMVDWQGHHTEERTFSSKTIDERYHDQQTIAKGSSVSGVTVRAAAGGDMTLTGSQVVSDQGTLLQAGGNLTLKEARSTDEYLNHRVEKESGIMGSGGFGITIGSREQGLDGSTKITQATGSTVGAISGDVTLLAGQKYTQTGSSVLATGVNGGGDVNILAKDIAITETRETTQNVTDTWFKQSGLTVAISNPVVNAIQTADQMAKAASHTSDSRMKALAAASTGMSAYSAYKAVEAGQGTTIDGKDNQIATGKTGADGKPETRDANSADKAGGVNISISVGSSSNKSHSESSSNISAGSRINAAGSINLVATGAGQDSNILIQGSDLKAAKDIVLAADNRIQLQASQDSDQQHGKNSGSSGSIGISFGTDGFMVNASASKSRGHADGDSVSYNNTHLNAGENVSLSSGGDLALKGAVVAGKQIGADVGGNLSIESLQDKNHYDSKQESLGGSISVGMGKMGGSLSYSKSKVNSDFNSVGEQSGLLAGDGGFNVKVKGDTTLTGGVITSTEQAVQEQKNQFQTGGKLAMTDLRNHAEYQASSESVNIGTSMSPQGAWSPSGSGIGFGNDSGSADSETRSGISGVAGNTAARTGDAQTGLKPIFDADKVQKEVDAQAQITQAFGQQASKTIGDYAGKQAKSLKAHAALETDDSKRQALLDEAARWDEGGAYRIAMHTAMGGLLGGVGGAAGAGATAASAPGLDKLQASVTENLRAAGLPGSAAQVAGSLISSGTAAGIGGVLGGTAGAAAGFDVDANNRQLHLNERKAIQKNSPAFAKKLSAELGRPVSVNEAERWLAEAAYANVDEAARKAQELLLPPNAAAEERQAYNQAKQYLFQIQQAEHNTALFSETNLGLYKNNFAGRDVNDPSYREFVWKNLGVNEKPTNPTATELAIYTERQKQLQLGTVKSLGMMLVTGGMSYVGGKVVNKLSPVSGSANSTLAAGKTGTVFDSITATQPVYPGSQIPKSFEMSLPNGQKVWVHGNATEHMAEYAAYKAIDSTPEAVRLATQVELNSFQSALNTATKNGMQYGRVTVDGWQLEIKPPRATGELPTVIHSRYLGSN